MIPTLILFGAVFGRWWRITLIVGTVGWVVALLATDVMTWEWGLIAAATLALANTLVGVLVHQAALWTYRRANAALTDETRPDESA